MSYKKIKITFNSLPVVNDYIELSLHAINSDVIHKRREAFKVSRLSNGQTRIAGSINDQAGLFQYAYNLDYGISFISVAEENAVYISCKDGNEFDYFLGCDISGSFAVFEMIDFIKDNVIHVIYLNPRKYVQPDSLSKCLATENNLFIITEDGKKIEL